MTAAQGLTSRRREESLIQTMTVDFALRAISEPRRRKILELVRDEELSAGEIASRFEISRPGISQHLRVLKEAGLVEERRAGTRRLYRVRTQGLEDLASFLGELCRRAHVDAARSDGAAAPQGGV